MNRRDFIITVSSATMLAALPSVSLASVEDAKKAIDEFIGGGTVSDGDITLELPEIAENGASVGMSVSVDSPMTKDDYVTDIAVFVDGNPEPKVANFKFTPHSGSADASVKIRLVEAQNVVAIAKTSTGKLYRAESFVKVTIGGCGG